jgi:outer membrane receptor protein involved in Fe transport
MKKILPTLLMALLAGAASQAQTALAGRVVDDESGEPILFGDVILYRNDVLLTGTQTDETGNYSFSNIDPGTYDVEVRYVGYQPTRVAGVLVQAGKANRLDVEISTGGGISLEQVIVVDYRVPLIEIDNTTSGGILTSEQIRSLPTRNINALAATTAGLATADEGRAINIRGSRTDATDYYIDGIRVQGSLLPESEIDQLQVITGGVEAQYGDVSGGIISITTKGPSQKFTGGVEMESSEYLDAYRNSLVGFNMSGPILRNKAGESILGYRVAGRFTYQVDDNPSAVPLFRVRDEALAELEANPVIELGGNRFVAADFLQQDAVNVIKARPFENFRRYDLTAKLDARLGRAIDVSLTGGFVDNDDRFTPSAAWRVYNSHNNPFFKGRTARGNFRFRHRLGQPASLGAAGAGPRGGILQNFSYTLQFGYENTRSNVGDIRHGENYFDYGYIGRFDVEWVPTFVEAFNFETQEFFLRHVDYRQVLRQYMPGAQNGVLANYNNIMGVDPNEGLNSQVGDFIISNAGAPVGNLITREQFLAFNGTLSNVFNSSWNLHTNVGQIYNLAQRGDNDIYTFSANANFDLMPGGAGKGRHNIQIGLWHEQRTNRGYSIFPFGLWNIARQQANNHILGIPDGADTIALVDYPGYPGTALLGLSTSFNPDNRFFRQVREVTGQALDEFVNVDGLSPDQLRLDMFSAKELNDQGIIDYFGYDYLGRPFNGNFEDFFRARDADGVRTFPVAPNRPIYSAAYIQDKFTYRDIIFRLGLRVDRYDANAKVLKDPYSLYEIMGADEYHGGLGTERPSNIGSDYKVYLDETGTSVLAYRNGDLWFRANGNPVNNPTEIEGIRDGLVFPKYSDPRVEANNNFIKSPDFDPSVAFEDYKPQINFMPRLAFSFPISSDANFFAHYDILVQRPPSNTIATARDYFYFTDINYNDNNPLNNPNLKPERTIDYEVGFQQKVSNNSAIKLSAYYKEMRNMIQLRTFFPVPLVNQYTTYDNIDFGTVKGFSFQYDLRRITNVSLLANYTLQFADGTGSNATSQRNLTSRGNLRALFPLDFDERHRINAILDFRYGSGRQYNGPSINGLDILSNFGVNLQLTTVSGRPFTATVLPLELGGAGVIGSLNGARKPWTYRLDMRVDKTFTLANRAGLNVYLRVFNVFDRRNVINVYSATGSPSDDGFLASANGQDQLRQIQNSPREVDAYLAAYSWRILNPGFFSLPRRIFLGAIIDF